MPNVADYEDQESWMSACVPTRIDEGDEQDQAVAVCLNIWRNRNKAMDAYKMTKGELLDAAERELPSSVINRISRADGTMGDLALELNRHRAMHTSNNILKTIRRSPYELTVGNHIILFGGRDLEGRASPNVNADGSKGEYFTADTILESSHTKAGILDVDWEHSQGELGDAVIGVVDWKTARVDDLGVFVERVLDRKNRYIQLLEQLGWFDDGMLGTSSQADPEGVEKAADGRITRWPLVRDTITVQPMEPRMIQGNQLQALKALGLVPDDNGGDGTEASPQQELETAPEAGTPAVAVAKARARLQGIRIRLLEEYNVDC